MSQDQYQVPEGVERYVCTATPTGMAHYVDGGGPWLRVSDFPKLRAAWAKERAEKVPDHIQVFRYEAADLNYEPLDSAPKGWDGNLNDLIGDYISVEALGEIKHQWEAEQREEVRVREISNRAERLAKTAEIMEQPQLSAALAQVALDALDANGQEVAEIGSKEQIEGLTEECPDCHGEVGGGGGNSDEPEWTCETCIWGRVPKAEKQLAEQRERLLGDETVLNRVARRHYERLSSAPFGAWEKVPEKYKIAFREEAQGDLDAALQAAQEVGDGSR